MRSILSLRWPWPDLFRVNRLKLHWGFSVFGWTLFLDAVFGGYHGGFYKNSRGYHFKTRNCKALFSERYGAVKPVFLLKGFRVFSYHSTAPENKR